MLVFIPNFPNLSQKFYSGLTKVLTCLSISEENQDKIHNLITYGVKELPKSNCAFINGQLNVDYEPHPHTLFATYLFKLSNKIANFKYIKVHDYDTWNADDTLSSIILPTLIKFKEENVGGPAVDLDDVPSYLHPSEEELSLLEENNTDAKYFDRWNYVLDEMIWTFNHLSKQWDEDTYDLEYNYFIVNRLKNGLYLFGKYYRSLWS